MSQKNKPNQAAGLQKNRRRKKTQTPLLLAVAGALLLLSAFILLNGGQRGGQQAAGATPASEGFAAKSNGPRLQVDKELVDFGEVKMETPVQAFFTLTNVGDETLVFSKEPYISVEAGC